MDKLSIAAENEEEFRLVVSYRVIWQK